MTTWQIHMATLPADIANARVLSAPFCGLSFIRACDGYPDAFYVIVQVVDGQLPVEVTGCAFGLLATLATSAHPNVVVLHRKSVDGPYDAAGLFTATDAALVVERLRAKE